MLIIRLILKLRETTDMKTKISRQWLAFTWPTTAFFRVHQSIANRKKDKCFWGRRSFKKKLMKACRDSPYEDVVHIPNIVSSPWVLRMSNTRVARRTETISSNMRDIAEDWFAINASRFHCILTSPRTHQMVPSWQSEKSYWKCSL